MKRSALVGLAVLVVAVAVPLVASAAGSGSAASQPNRNLGRWTTTAVSTTSRSFRPLGGMGARICAAGAVEASVSVNASGAPLQFLVLVDDGAVIAPGAVTLTPVGRGTVGTFGFLANAQPFEANDHHAYQVEWRSLTGGSTRIASATMDLLYQEGTHGC